MRPLQLAIVIMALAWMPRCTSAQEEPSGDRPSQTLEDRIASISKALEANPRDTKALGRRASLYAGAGRPELAIADFDRLLKLDPSLAGAFDARGSEHFKLRHIDESIADFDRALKLQPRQEPWHWKRGISYYYAGRYAEGRKQFEGYQTVDDNDVENAVWRYLCMARAEGARAARNDMLKIKPDLRVGMMAVYALYSGKAKPLDVLAAARAGSPTAEQLNARLFYAHLYLGLYWESLGKADKAHEHIAKAVEHRIGHYMWNVADVHARRFKKKTER